MKTLFNTLSRVALFTGLSTISIAANSQISGSVFRDINNDGIRQLTNPIEPMEFGVVVNAYDGGNVLIGTATTNVNGIYSFSAGQAPSGLAVRLEFILKSGDQPSKRIAGNRSNVQFVVAGAAAVNINFAIASKKLFSDNSNPWVATSSFINGDANATGAGNAGDYDNLHVFPYDMSNDGGSTRRTKNQFTGSVFGLAWQKESRTLFMAAYLKRHSGFGPDGIGAIYQTQIPLNGVPSKPTLLVDVAAIGINVGIDPRSTTLPASASTPNTDAGVFAEVGKRGIGGIELSNDGRELYIVNMYEKKLQRINIGNPLKSSFTAADVTGSWVIPDPSTPTTEWHPMALKMKNNKLYIGGICTKETTTAHNIADTANLRGVVFEFDPATNTFTEVLRFPLSHRKGFTNADFRYEFRNNYWSAWQNNGDISIGGPLRAGLIGSLTGSNATGVYYTQPMFSAIEFDADGSMIIGLRDRFGDQAGYANFFETGNEPGERYRALSAGEVLRAGKNGSAWVFERNGSVTTNGFTTTTLGLTTNNPSLLGSWNPLQLLTPWGGNYGPGGGYYYYNHNFSNSGVPAPYNAASTITNHYLKSIGGLAYLPGYNEVITPAIDPMSRSFSNGIIKNVNLGSEAGNMSARMELFASATGDPARNGKAAALGDVEILLDAATMEIGNRVWNDANANGIQDAHEVGIAGVQVVLRSPGADGVYQNGDDQTWTLNTDANGNYYFDETVVNDSRRPSSWLGVSSTNSGILPGFEYRIEIDKAQTALSSYRYLSGINPSANKSVNSNGVLNGASVRYVVNPGGSTAAGSVFENDYDVDFGFFAAVLSVQQLDLKAVLEKNTTHLTWNTVGESNVKQYYIERSIDGTNFSSIGSLSSKGTGNFSYLKDDNIESLSAGSVYYRLYIEDMNGQFKYSAIVKVGLNKNIKVAMMPNPFTSFINLQIDNTKREDASIRIFNVTGQVVYKKSLILEKGLNSILLDDMQRLPAGTYILDVRAGENSLTQKIVKR